MSLKLALCVLMKVSLWESGVSGFLSPHRGRTRDEMNVFPEEAEEQNTYYVRGNR